MRCLICVHCPTITTAGPGAQHNGPLEILMDKLAEQQREMRERMAQSSAATKKRKKSIEKNSPILPLSKDDEVSLLKQKVSALEAQNEQLRVEISSLRRQKTVVVEQPRSERSHEDSVQQQRHNFFKYSNIRRY